MGSVGTGLQKMSRRELVEEVEALRRRVAELEGEAGRADDEPSCVRPGRAPEAGGPTGRLHEYERLCEASPNLVCLVDLDYRYRVANRAFLSFRNGGRDVVGRSVPEITGMEVFEKDIKWRLDRCFQGEVVEYEAEYADGRGWRRSFLVSYFPLVGPDGVDRVACVSRDITEQKHLHEGLKESERKYRRLFETLPDGFIAVSKDSRITEANDAFAFMTGYSREELIGMPLDTVTPPRWRAFEKENIVPQLIARGYSDVYEKEHAKKDGTSGAVEVRVHLEEKHEGRNSRAWAFVRDVSERKAIEKALRESEDRFRILFEKWVYPVLLMEGDVYVDCNEAALKFMGCRTKEELIGLKPWDISPQRQPDGMLSTKKADELIRTTLAGGSNSFEWMRRTFDGREVWMDVSQTVVPIEGRNFLYTMWRDISERKRTEEALRKREAELEENARSLEEANTALRVLLKRTDKDRKALERSVASNVKELVLPYLQKLRSRNLTEHQLTCLEIIESNLREIVSPFIATMSRAYANFTPMELQIADLIGSGKTNKEIAETLNVGVGTVHFHRNNIRAKLGLTNKDVNLRAYLLSFAE